ncbi:ketol-acid reductoisomerase [Sulfidibacter corallicola]|uniref:Ketol-acid reductoisomerase (NADP(+)) n=1 Tax=Sulfidibacter corallicola TaxID=2818388 RepID=A0A8A4TRY5_SULCO|nr:ketol-acid reductoisomerase [Sulfidibacter corallicola]QTD52310.1 ketol-acid reductoisomerase [Sulfidibacter corallicola]
MTKMYREQDAKPQVLEGKKLAVLGYGSQGRAHALNLRESGYQVALGLRPGGKSWQRAEGDGWEPVSPGEAVVGADLVAILVPDMAQAKLYEDFVAPNLKPGAALLFAHGFNVHFGHIAPPKDTDVIMVAPKSPGDLVRRQYQEGRGVPCLVAVHQNPTGEAFDRALAYAHGLGGTRAGVLETNFAEETETDLFGEQAVLCGGVTELIRYGYETLVEAGYQPEAAYFECLHELKLIVDLIYEGGFTKMHEFVSETAKYGDLTRGPRVVDPSVKENMKEILTEIQSGTFAKEWAEENKAGLPKYRELLQSDLEHPIEEVGQRLRNAMSWIRPRLEEAK